MARPIWNGVRSFGLLNVPVSVMSGERKVDLHFRMLDARDRKPIRYERVNSETGEEVPWKSIVKAFEYEKGGYVVLESEDICARRCARPVALVSAGSSSALGNTCAPYCRSKQRWS